MIDMHSHIVFGVDDGSKDEEMTLEMLKQAERSGTTKIVATPHFYRGRYDYEYGEILEKIDYIKKLAKDNFLDIEIYSGQEIYFNDNLIHYYNDKMIGTINNSRYMLIELPLMDFDLDKVIDKIYELKIKGIVPIIAHPERYVPFIKEPHLINKLIKEGYLFQLNVGSLTGRFGKDVMKLAKKYYENDIYSVIGSDAHSCNRRNTNISGINDVADSKKIITFNNNGNAILNNEEIKFNGTLIEKRKKFLGIF